MMKNNICQECKAMVKFPNEFHPYEYCVLAKAFPNDWREKIKYIINNANKFEKAI